jgi:hypothetical protein
VDRRHQPGGGVVVVRVERPALAVRQPPMLES